VRAPRTSDKQAKAQATAAFMPPLSGDGGGRREGNPSTWLTVTSLQYMRLKLWARGAFPPEAADAGSEEARPSGACHTGLTPAELDRAALENCVGGGFFPGIEVSSRIRNGSLYVKDGSSAGDRYRLDHKNLWAGALTEQMAVPWQADFADCEGFWWPAQRPAQVVVEGDYESVVDRSYTETRPGPWIDTLAFPRRRWARGIGDRSSSIESNDPGGRERWHRDMVSNWSKLGFIVPRTTPDKQTVWTETERGSL
jgi:hypothetical protein